MFPPWPQSYCRRLLTALPEAMFLLLKFVSSLEQPKESSRNIDQPPHNTASRLCVIWLWLLPRHQFSPPSCCSLPCSSSEAFNLRRTACFLSFGNCSILQIPSWPWCIQPTTHCQLFRSCYWTVDSNKPPVTLWPLNPFSEGSLAFIVLILCFFLHEL